MSTNFKILSRREFYEECTNIHKTSLEVRILSKTPGLFLNPEREKHSNYFNQIDQSLKHDESYFLNYLFDKYETLEYIVNYVKKKKYSSEDCHNFLSVLTYNIQRYAMSFDENFRIYVGDTYPLTGMVLSDEIVVISFPKGTKYNFVHYALRYQGEGYSDLIKFYLATYDDVINSTNIQRRQQLLNNVPIDQQTMIFYESAFKSPKIEQLRTEEQIKNLTSTYELLTEKILDLD